MRSTLAAYSVSRNPAGGWPPRKGEEIQMAVTPLKIQHSHVVLIDDRLHVSELRKQVRDLLDDSGTIGLQVRAFTVSNADMLTRVNTLLGKIEQKLQLDDAVERSVHKGRPFEEIVQAELEAIHGPLGDQVL